MVIISIIFKVLKDWVNDVLADTRVVVKSIEEDFNDGQVLAMLLGKQTRFKLLFLRFFHIIILQNDQINI